MAEYRDHEGDCAAQVEVAEPAHLCVQISENYVLKQPLEKK
jgi:hypothetical protein